MGFLKYQHIERLGADEVEGIEFGECYIFYKIDGTNGSLWWEDGELKAGSRNRELSLDNDNANFYNSVYTDDRYKKYFEKYPNHRLWGEWLVPHSLKTYRDSAWRKFYIFDVTYDSAEDDKIYFSYEEYKEFLEGFDIDYIPPIAKVKNPTEDTLIRFLEKSGEFLVRDGGGIGEGIVIKNYNYRNKYGRRTWAKIVANEFKEKHRKSMGVGELKTEMSVEEKIVEKYCTESFIEKEYSKIVNEQNGWKSQYIPMLLGRVYSELIKEEMWNIVKEFKNPKVDFRLLMGFVNQRVKEVKYNLF
jgi:hypothetical protein